jgi:HEAT repeat protein
MTEVGPLLVVGVIALGSLRWWLRFRWARERMRVIARALGLTELAKRLLLRDDEIPTRLATNATSDKNPAVRLTNLRFLIKNDRGAAVATAACNQALTDPSPELRLEAAIFLGDDGIETLMAIASETTVDQEMRIRAIRALARPFWTLRSLPLLESLLGEEQPPPVRRIAIAGIGSILRGASHRPAPGTLQRLIELVADADNATAENLARTIGQIGDPAGEPGLLQLLTHKDHKVKRAAAFSLGIVGTAESVAPLLRIGKGRNPWIKHAIARIQARLAGAGKGQLSISVPGDSSGGLSIAKDDETGGELSLAEKGEADASMYLGADVKVHTVRVKKVTLQ